jgi:hypothetical protein
MLQYVDKTRGPLNEGGLYGERQGWHLPGFDDSHWTTSKPTDGIAQAGVQFYRFVLVRFSGFHHICSPRAQDHVRSQRSDYC